MAATNAEIIGLDAIKLIESGLGAICDATVAVTAPEEVRASAHQSARDSITEEYARSRIAAQKEADYFRAQCDYEFVNDLPTAEKAEHAAEVYINTIINNLKEE
ncbi:MAG: dephospho-CoA kinase [Oscillospiraceae bacterium]